MEKMHMFLEPGREEMEGARRATGISSLDEAAGGGVVCHSFCDSRAFNTYLGFISD